MGASFDLDFVPAGVGRFRVFVLEHVQHGCGLVGFAGGLASVRRFDYSSASSLTCGKLDLPWGYVMWGTSTPNASARSMA